MERVLTFRGRHLSLDLNVHIPPYNQVSQTLLDPAGAFAANHHGVNAVFIRIEDLARFDRHDPETLPRIESNLRALLDVVLQMAARRDAMKPLTGKLAQLRAARVQAKIGNLERTVVVVESQELLVCQKRGIAVTLRKAKVELSKLDRLVKTKRISRGL